MTGVGSVLGFVTAVASNVKVKAMGVIDAIFPPAKRAEMLSRLQTWAVSNPKLAVRTKSHTGATFLASKPRADQNIICRPSS